MIWKDVRAISGRLQKPTTQTRTRTCIARVRKIVQHTEQKPQRIAQFVAAVERLGHNAAAD